MTINNDTVSFEYLNQEMFLKPQKPVENTFQTPVPDVWNVINYNENF